MGTTVHSLSVHACVCVRVRVRVKCLCVRVHLFVRTAGCSILSDFMVGSFCLFVCAFVSSRTERGGPSAVLLGSTSSSQALTSGAPPVSVHPMKSSCPPQTHPAIRDSIQIGQTRTQSKIKSKSTSWPFPNKRSQACHLAITMSQIVMCSNISPDKKWRLESNLGPIANVYRRMLDHLSYSRLVLRTARRQLLCLAKKMNLLCSICMLHVEGQSRNLLEGDSG
jgi:hypothetical protein